MSPAWCARNHPNLRCYVALHRFSSSTEIRLQPLLDLHWQQGCNIPLVALFFFGGGGGIGHLFPPPLYSMKDRAACCALCTLGVRAFPPTWTNVVSRLWSRVHEQRKMFRDMVLVCTVPRFRVYVCFSTRTEIQGRTASNVLCQAT